MSADLPSFVTTRVELHRRNSASFRLHDQTCAAVVVEGATVIPLHHGATTMLALGLLLNFAGIGLFCWLIFTLAVYVLPFFVAIHAGFWAYHSGAGLLGTPIVAVAAGAFTLALAQLAFAMTQFLILRGLIAALFTLPATLAGYHVAFAMAQFGVSSPAWQHVFACVGAIFIGSTAWTRLTVFTEPRPLDSNGATGIGAQPILTTAAHKQ